MKLLSDSINVFVESKDTKEGKIKVFTTSIGNKEKDGTYTNKSLEISFAKDCFTKEILEKLVEGYVYKVEVRDGFLTCRKYQDKSGKKVVVLVAKILKAKVLDRKELAPTQEKLPF